MRHQAPLDRNDRRFVEVLRSYVAVRLQVGACKSGLSAVLVQDGSLIAYASRSLTETEREYAQIEKELLTAFRF